MLFFIGVAAVSNLALAAGDWQSAAEAALIKGLS